MNARIAIEGAVLSGAAITLGLFALRNRGERNVAAASSKAGSSNLVHRELVSSRLVPARRPPHVKLRLSLVGALVACLLFTCKTASAQEVIHAVSGKVASVSAAGKSVSLKLDDGSIRTFKVTSGAHAASSLEKTVGANAIPASGFDKPSGAVILFYYGVGDQCTAVAYKDAGAAPSSRMSGVVSQFERKQHLLTLVGAASQKEQIALPEQTVVETPEGVIDGLQFRPSKGDHLEVIWLQANGQPTALFISQS
jgi:hypothetical protein